MSLIFFDEINLSFGDRSNPLSKGPTQYPFAFSLNDGMSVDFNISNELYAMLLSAIELQI